MPGSRIALRAVIVATLLLAACVGTLHVSIASTLPPPQVRVAHASPDAPAVDILVNGELFIANLGFGQVSAYQTTGRGTFDVEVVAAGTAGPAVIDESLTFSSGKAYTIAATDVLTSITPIFVEDDNTLPDLGQASLRFMHLSPDAPAVDVAVTDGPILFGNAAFGEVADYITVAAGVYDLEVRLAGTEIVALPLPGIVVPPNAVITFYAIGLAAGVPPLMAASTIDAGMAQVRLAHASPDAPAVDCLVDGVKAFDNYAFGEVSPYMLVPGGEHLVEVVAAGTLEPAVISEQITFDPLMAYTVAATDELASITPIVFTDTLDLPPAGQTKVRLVHLSPDAPAVTVSVTDGPELFSDIGFQSASEYVVVGAGVYPLDVAIAGTSTVVLSIPGVPLAADTIYSVFAMGKAVGEPALNAILCADVGTSRVRAVHTSVDAPAVDVFVDGTVAIQELGYGSFSHYQTVSSGTHLLQVVPTGAPPPGVITSTVHLKGETDYTVVAIDSLAQIDALVLEDDNSPPPAGQCRIRFVHASPGAPTVDMAVRDGPTLFESVSFKDATDYILVNAGRYQIDVKLAGSDLVALTVPNLDLAAGDVYTVVAAGLPMGQPPLEALFSVDARFLYPVYLPLVLAATS